MTDDTHRELEGITSRFTQILKEIGESSTSSSSSKPNYHYPTSYLAQSMAKSISEQPMPSKCFFNACLHEISATHAVTSDPHNKSSKLGLGSVGCSPHTFSTQDGQKFYTTSSQADTPFELSRFLLHLQGTDCAFAKDPVRHAENEFNVVLMPPRAQHDGAVAGQLHPVG